MGRRGDYLPKTGNSSPRRPTHDAAETNKRGIFGFYEPRDGWFRFEETSVSGQFTDANGNRVMSCVSSCPTPYPYGRF